MEKLYRRVVPITPQDEMHLQVDHYLEPLPAQSEEVEAIMYKELENWYSQDDDPTHEMILRDFGDEFEMGCRVIGTAIASLIVPQQREEDIKQGLIKSILDSLDGVHPEYHYQIIKEFLDDI